MNLRTLWLLILPAASCCCAQEIALRDNIDTKLRESFRYSPAKQEELESANKSSVESEADTVNLKTMSVVEAMTERALTKAIDRRIAIENDAKIGWKKGGIIARDQLGKVEVEYGLWPKLEDSQAPSVSNQHVMLRVDVLHFRW